MDMATGKQIRRGWATLGVLVAVVAVVVVVSTLQQASHQYAPTGDESFIVGTVTAGPVCPVEQVPPAPGCAPRPVPGATLVLGSAEQGKVATATTGADGSYRITIHGYGTYTLTARPVPGLLGTPAPVTVDLAPFQTQRVDLSYDTGIR